MPGRHSRVADHAAPVGGFLAKAESWAFALMLGFLAGCVGVPNGVQIKLDAPGEAAVGEPFEIVAAVRNPTSKTIRVPSLLIYNSYLDGIEIESSRPAYDGIRNHRILGFRTYRYALDVPPGAQKEIRFTALATRPGVYTGDFAFCFGWWDDCPKLYLRTQVDGLEQKDAPADE